MQVAANIRLIHSFAYLHKRSLKIHQCVSQRVEDPDLGPKHVSNDSSHPRCAARWDSTTRNIIANNA